MLLFEHHKKIRLLLIVEESIFLKETLTVIGELLFLIKHIVLKLK